MVTINSVIENTRKSLANEISTVNDIKEVSADAKEWDVVRACKVKLEKMYFADKILADIEKQLINSNGE
jgi:hypothetical protein